jgi:ABC-type Mn2+/Zn2+ transport system permease subunit
MTTLSASTLLLAGSMAVAAGLIGAFALMRRMALAADALSHVALPGIGLAILVGMHPLAGALAALAIGAILVWGLEGRARLGAEAVTGVVFSTALALGALLTSGEELLDALFGHPGSLSTLELVAGVGGAAAVIAFALLARHRLIVTLVSADVARTAGIAVRRLELAFLLAFALAVGLGLRYLGVLLMGSLVIIPPAAARQLARGLTEMLALSAGLALVATLVGTWLAAALHRESGPLIIAVAAICFALALLVPRRAVQHA